VISYELGESLAFLVLPDEADDQNML
jgi:hypothetical protein